MIAIPTQISPNVTVSGIRVLNQSEEHTYSFTFTTGDIFEKPVYDSDAAWSDTTNTHEVWRWLYRNTLTKDTLTPYVYYTLTAQNSTSEYVAPKKDEDGNYNYLLFGESTDKTKVSGSTGSSGVSAGSAGTGSPKTGDDSGLVDMMTLLILSTACLAAMTHSRRLPNRRTTSLARI